MTTEDQPPPNDAWPVLQAHDRAKRLVLGETWIRFWYLPRQSSGSIPFCDLLSIFIGSNSFAGFCFHILWLVSRLHCVIYAIVLVLWQLIVASVAMTIAKYMIIWYQLWWNKKRYQNWRQHSNLMIPLGWDHEYHAHIMHISHTYHTYIYHTYIMLRYHISCRYHLSYIISYITYHTYIIHISYIYHADIMQISHIIHISYIYHTYIIHISYIYHGCIMYMTIE